MDEATVRRVQELVLNELLRAGFRPPGCRPITLDVRSVACPACAWPLRATGIGGPGPVQVAIGPRTEAEEGGCDVCRGQLSFTRTPG